MRDSFGREINYLRLSITDRCNLRCRYCMPNGIETIPMEELLSFEEIVRIAGVATGLGIDAFKITGGEPLVRKGCTNLVRMLKETEGVRQVTMTSNGVLVSHFLDELVDAGLDAINISLDTTDREQYRAITGFDELDTVMRAIEMSSERIRTKINVVLQRGLNEDAWEDLLLIARDLPVDVRFIEMMPIGLGKENPAIGNPEMIEKIRRHYPGMVPDESAHGNGPSVYYQIPGFQGSVGFISAMFGKFCDACNRMRLTSTGEIKPCLCYREGFSLREAARGGDLDQIREILIKAIEQKPQAHCFEEPGAMSEERAMNRIGG